MDVEECYMHSPKDRWYSVSSSCVDPVVIWYAVLFHWMNNLSRHGVDKEFSISRDCPVGCNLAVRVGIVSESERDSLVFKLEDECNSIKGQWLLIMAALKILVYVPFIVCHMLHVEVDCLFSGQSVLWDQRVIACPLFLNQKLACALVRT